MIKRVCNFISIITGVTGSFQQAIFGEGLRHSFATPNLFVLTNIYVKTDNRFSNLKESRV